MGLAEQAPSDRMGKHGLRIIADGWQCMNGRAYEECMAPGRTSARTPKSLAMAYGRPGLITG
jgi:hypothetical protein